MKRILLTGGLGFIGSHTIEHYLRYSLDGAALKQAGWQMPISTEESFTQMVQWTLQNPQWLN